MATYTITLTDSQDKALSSICASNQDWINNAISERCRLATLDIVNLVVQKCTAGNIPIPATQDAMVQLAFTNGWVITGAQQNINSVNATTIASSTTVSS
jgi:hypothetical protein